MPRTELTGQRLRHRQQRRLRHLVGALFGVGMAHTIEFTFTTEPFGPTSAGVKP